MALSIRPPWSDLIVAGKKDIENRSWTTRLRGPIAIHSSGRWGATSQEAFALFEQLRIRPPRRPPELVPAIIGVARVHAVVEYDASPWFGGPYGWVLKDARRIDPIPINGRLGLWTVPPDVEKEIYRRLAALRKRK
jgi:hypothetical protein